MCNPPPLSVINPNTNTSCLSLILLPFSILVLSTNRVTSLRHASYWYTRRTWLIERHLYFKKPHSLPNTLSFTSKIAYICVAVTQALIRKVFMFLANL